MHTRSPTAHPALPPSVQVNELRDRLMLLEVCQLIGTPHLLPLLRERAEATEMLLRVKGAAGAGDPTALAMMGGGGAGATPARRLEMEAPPSSVEVGEALLIDNTRVLHGRHAFTGHRNMLGCYMTTDDWQSKLRVLERRAAARARAAHQRAAQTSAAPP